MKILKYNYKRKIIIFIIIILWIIIESICTRTYIRWGYSKEIEMISAFKSDNDEYRKRLYYYDFNQKNDEVIGGNDYVEYKDMEKFEIKYLAYNLLFVKFSIVIILLIEIIKSLRDNKKQLLFLGLESFLIIFLTTIIIRLTNAFTILLIPLHLLRLGIEIVETVIMYCVNLI